MQELQSRFRMLQWSKYKKAKQITGFVPIKEIWSLFQNVWLSIKMMPIIL